MKKINLSIILLILLIISACSTHTTNIKTGGIASIGDISVTVTANHVNEVIANKFSRYLQAALLQNGYNLVPESPTVTNLKVNLLEFSPGSQALRLTVGFGAGRGTLSYKAIVTQNGKVLVDYDGAEHLTGVEVNPGTRYRPVGNWAGEDTATLILLEEATDHIINNII